MGGLAREGRVNEGYNEAGEGNGALLRGKQG